jgi:hypothetical protein
MRLHLIPRTAENGLANRGGHSAGVAKLSLNEGAPMSRRSLAKFVLLIFPLLFVSKAIAEKGSVEISKDITLNGKAVRAGTYQLKWSGTGNVDLTFLQDGKVIATVPAHTIPLQEKSHYDSATLTKNADGSESLVEIDFSNKKYGLSLGNSSVTQTENGANE